MVIAPLNHEYGLGYLIAAVILGGLIQIALGALGVAKLMRFVPRSVMVGFVNALAILIFMAQVPEMRGVPWAVYPPIIGGLAFMVFFPKITTVIPAPLVSIVILAVITVPAGTAVPNVGDKGSCPRRCRCRACSSKEPLTPRTAVTASVTPPQRPCALLERVRSGHRHEARLARLAGPRLLQGRPQGHA